MYEVKVLIECMEISQNRIKKLKCYAKLWLFMHSYGCESCITTQWD